MKGRYNGVGDDRMTDEFMKPIIVDKSGLVQSKFLVVFCIDEGIARAHNILHIYSYLIQLQIVQCKVRIHVRTQVDEWE